MKRYLEIFLQLLLREPTFEIIGNASPESIVRRLREDFREVSYFQFSQPFHFELGKKTSAYIGQNRFIIRRSGLRYPVSGRILLEKIFATESWFAFYGKIRKIDDNVQILGVYKIVPIFRHFFVLGFIGVILFSAISMALFAVFLVQSDFDRAISSLAILGGGCLLVFMFYGALHFSLFLSKKTLSQIVEYLIEISKE